MNDLVRVKNAVTGAEYNWSRTLADADPDLTIVDRPTHDAGNQIPPVYGDVEVDSESKPSPRPRHRTTPRTPRRPGGDTATAAATTEADTKEATES